MKRLPSASEFLNNLSTVGFLGYLMVSQTMPLNLKIPLWAPPSTPESPVL